MGKRFAEAGCKKIKPLIEVNGKPMIESVIDLFPGEKDFLFICNKDHLRETNLEEVLMGKAPDAKIIGIPKHSLGPVYAVLQAEASIPDDDEVIVNYCDFNAYWDYKKFRKHLNEEKPDGCLSAYTGFHPHLLWKNKYAGMRVSPEKKLLEIKEKHCFTENPENSYHSAGTYYFRKGVYIKKYFHELMDKKISLNNEYYVSSVYSLMLEDKLDISVYTLDFFLQWGTPEDLEEYVYWQDFFLGGKIEQSECRVNRKTTILMPMAGKGKRFVDEGWAIPKPLIEVDGKPIFLHAFNSLPKADEVVFVCRKEHITKNNLDERILARVPNAKIISVEKDTQGQADSCLLAEKYVDPESSLVIAACDNKMIWDAKEYSKLAGDKNVAAVLWTFRGNPAVNRKPEAYAYAEVSHDNLVANVSCKKPVSDKPIYDHSITGNFYFRKAGDFFDATRRMMEKNLRVNGEFYADLVPNELIAVGKTVKAFDAFHYIVFGTPSDLLTFVYWKKYFNLVGGKLHGKA